MENEDETTTASAKMTVLGDCVRDNGRGNANASLAKETTTATFAPTVRRDAVAVETPRRTLRPRGAAKRKE